MIEAQLQANPTVTIQQSCVDDESNKTIKHRGVRFCPARSGPKNKLDPGATELRSALTNPVISLMNSARHKTWLMTRMTVIGILTIVHQLWLPLRPSSAESNYRIGRPQHLYLKNFIRRSRKPNAYLSITLERKNRFRLRCCRKREDDGIVLMCFKKACAVRGVM